MTKRPYHYKGTFRNVYVRWAFVIFGLPFVIPIALIASAAVSITTNLLDEAAEAFKDSKTFA